MYTPEETIIHKLLLIREEIHNSCEEALSAVGLNYDYYMTLLFAYNHPGISQTDLAVINHKNKNVIGHIIDRMESLGIIRREKAPEDRRVYNLYVTEYGESVVRDYWKYITAAEEKTLSRYTPEERRALLDALQKMEPGA